MIERVKDWKTTIPGLVIGMCLIGAAVIAMWLHRDWTWREVVDFVGGLAVVVAGALARSGVVRAVQQNAATAPGLDQPKEPPAGVSR